MVISAFWIARQLTPGYEIAPLPGSGNSILEATGARIDRALQRGDFENLSHMLERLGRRNKTALMLVEVENREFIYGFPRPLRPNKEPFMQLLTQTTALSVKTPVGHFYGPHEITIDNKAFKLFVGKQLRPGLFQQFRHQHPGAFVVSIILVSGLLCAWLAWSLVKPIRQLSKAARKMSQGDLATRVGSASKRGDEIGQLGQDFNQMAEQVELSVHRQKRLLADISHELRSPLARMQVAIGIADQQGQPPSPPIQKQILRIEKEAQQIEQMLGHLLQLSKLDGKEQTLNHEDFDFSEFIQYLVDDAEFEAQAAQKSVVLTSEQGIRFTGDSNILASAIGNVLRNAVKYSTTKVEVNVSCEASKLIVDVVDDGEGVPASMLEDIFTPFYRISASRNRGSGGVGLGLAIAKQAIMAHQGEINASRGALGGLRVNIQLPITMTNLNTTVAI